MSVPSYPDSLSPSRAADFQTCALLYRLRSIDKLPEPPSPAAIRGTLVHAALERMFAEPPSARTKETVISNFVSAALDLEFSQPTEFAALVEGMQSHSVEDELLRQVETLVHSYFELEDPRRLQPFSLEQELTTQLEPHFSIRGFVDRIDKAPDGRIRIVDYKTGKAPHPRYEAKALFQLKFYALMWWKNTGDIPALLQLMYLGNTKVIRYSPSESDLVATERKIIALRDAIARCVSEGFRPTSGPLCGWCAYKELCPEFGGTPPPLPDVNALVGQPPSRPAPTTTPTSQP